MAAEPTERPTSSDQPGDGPTAEESYFKAGSTTYKVLFGGYAGAIASWGSSPVTRVDHERKIMPTLAGLVAVDRSGTNGGGPGSVVARHQLMVAKVTESARLSCPDLAHENDIEAWLDGLHCRMGNILNTIWLTVEAVAATYATEQTVDDDKVRELYAATMPRQTLPAYQQPNRLPSMFSIDDENARRIDMVHPRTAVGGSEHDVLGRRDAGGKLLISRHFQLLAHELRTVRLSFEETCLLVTVCPGDFPPYWSPGYLKAQYELTIEGFRGAHQSPVARALGEKLAALSPGQEAAVLEALARLQVTAPTLSALERIALAGLLH